MPKLNVRGIRSAATASQYSSDEVGTIDDTFLFPQWWDKKGTVQYIRCFKLHMTRVCDDIDVIIPANADVCLEGTYDGNMEFKFHYFRGVKRIGITAPNSSKVLAEFIFPRMPGGSVAYKKYGEGPVVCFSSLPFGSWKTFIDEHAPDLNLGDLSPADGFYDLNESINFNYDIN